MSGINGFKIYAAPLQGYTEALWRCRHYEIFGGVDCYFTPFMRVEKGGVRQKDIRDLSTRLNTGVPVIPQAIFSCVDELRSITDVVRQCGYDRLDLNLGCPFPPQWRKGRGAGMICRLDEMSNVAEFVRSNTDIRFSVKMRLGVEQPDEYRALLPVLNGMLLEHIAVHPRVARQQYSGELAMDEFGRLLEKSAWPVIFNGEIRSVEDIDRIRENYPSLAGVMVGRGLLARPSLATEWRIGSLWTQDKLLGSILLLHDGIYAACRSSLCGDSQILSKIKPFWDYPASLIDRRVWKAIHKANSIRYYEAAVAMLR